MVLRILIVDDELIIREGIGRKIERLIPNAIVIGKAQDAIEGLEIFKATRPDVIITDIRMPEIDGLQFICNVKEIDSSIKFIVISGFQDFEFARSALRLGVEDYLLKPIDNNQLIEIFKKLEKQFKDENKKEEQISKLKNNASTGIHFLKNKYLTDLLDQNDTLDNSHILKNLNLLGVNFLYNNFSVINITVSSFENMILFPDKEDISLAKFAIRNIGDEIFSNLGSVTSFELLRDEHQLIFIVNYDVNDNTEHFRDIDKLCEKVLYSVNKFLKINVTIGVGNSYIGITALSNSYLEAYTAVTQKFVLGDNRVINSKDILNINKTVYFLPEDNRILLVNYIKEGNSKRAIEIIEKVFESITNINTSYSNIKILYIDLFMLFTKTVKEVGGSCDNIFSNNIFSESHMSQYLTLKELLACIKDSVLLICGYINDLRKSHGRKVIEEIKDYINNYYYSDVNLNDLSTKYCLNSNYLSQLFKNETGETFLNFLTTVRMLKAKELLLDTDLKSYKISEMVGYNNPRYFSEVFQKNFNCTPTEFRENSSN